MDKSCIKCTKYSTLACLGAEKRQMYIEDYDYDCFLSKEDQMLHDLMCGEVEDGEM